MQSRTICTGVNLHDGRGGRARLDMAVMGHKDVQYEKEL